MKKTQVSNDSSSELLSTTITLLIVGKYDGTSNNLASSFQEARKEMLKHGWSYIKFDSDAKILTLMTFIQENPSFTNHMTISNSVLCLHSHGFAIGEMINANIISLCILEIGEILIPFDSILLNDQLS